MKPLPLPRPGGFPAAQSSESRSGCEQELAAIASVAKQHVVTGPDGCGGSELVRLSGLTLSSGAPLALNPPSVLRCEMALAVAQWLRQQVAALVPAKTGATPVSEVAGSYECRGRNRVKGAKLSEHGTGGAIDISGFPRELSTVTRTDSTSPVEPAGPAQLVDRG
jgi:hypothetical protein